MTVEQAKRNLLKQTDIFVILRGDETVAKKIMKCKWCRNGYKDGLQCLLSESANQGRK